MAIRLATVFSGIGAVEFAFRRMHIAADIVFACDNGEREIQYDRNIELRKIKKLTSPQEKSDYVLGIYERSTRKKNYVRKSYLANYDMKKGIFFEDVCLLDGTDFVGQVDLFVGGSPCQSFSSVGAQGGLEDARGTLFYEYARLIKEIKPKVFIYENVQNILRHDDGKTWDVMKKIFSSLGYEFDYKVLNAVDYGIPQIRNRVFVVGYRKDLKKAPSVGSLSGKPLQYDMHQFLESYCRNGGFVFDEVGKLEIKQSRPTRVADCYYLTPGIRRYVMNEGTKNFKTKIRIDLPVARTLLKTMHWHHRAGVDNYMEEFGSIRMLTEREAHRLMGFTDDYKIVVSRTQAYMQAGNSIVVDVMMEVLKSILKDGVL